MTPLGRLKLELGVIPSDLGLSTEMELDNKLTAFLDLADTLRPTASDEEKYQHAKALVINNWIRNLGIEASSKTLGDYSISKNNSTLIKLLRIDYIKALKAAEIITVLKPRFAAINMEQGL